MIYHDNPKSWQGLQDKVGEILEDAGYSVSVDQKLTLARGEAKIDVLATNTKETIFSECKYWTKKVPQTVVHAFRSVVQDGGANRAFIISLRGFQKGAFTAASNTNLRLLDWFEFQECFEEEWLKTTIVKLYKESDHLFRYTDILVDKELLHGLNNKEEKYYWKLHKNYAPICTIIGSLHMDITMLEAQGINTIAYMNKHYKFPSDYPIPMVQKQETIMDFRQLIDYLTKYNREGIIRFRTLTNNYAK